MKNLLTTVFGPPQGPPLRRTWRTVLAALVLLCALPLASRAQLVSTYAFAASTGTFTPISGTAVPVLLADEGVTPAIALGFTFRFDGNDYTSVYANSNGILSFNPAADTDYGNDLSTVHATVDPVAAVLWDDLTGATPGAAATYSVTGAVGSRVFTFEWLNWGWNYAAAAGGVSFQVKLREGSNQVEYVYRPEAGTLNSPSATVGLRSTGGAGQGSFLSVSNLTTAAVSSASISTNDLAAKPTAGLRFTFTPTPCAAPPTYATLPVSQSFETTWTDACAVRNAAGASWRTTPVIGDNSWRREDDGAAASWRTPAGYLPTPVSSQGSHAAIFHSSYTPVGVTGNLDLYVNLSGGGTKVLTFDYVNVVQGIDNDQLDVLVSTDGGQTFGSSLLTLTTANTYAPHTLVIPSTSATSVIRFRGTGDYSTTDIGLDNVQLVGTTCAPPTAPVISAITTTTATLNYTASASAVDYTVTYQRQGGPVQTVSPNPTGTTVPLSGLTPASVYTVTVVSNCSSGGPSAATSPLTFTTATPATPVPANDLCGNAQSLTPATTCTNTTGTVGGATATLADGKLDVWYTFTATSTEHHIVVLPTAGASPVTVVFTGSTCPGNATVPLSYNSSSSDTYLTGLTPTQVYLVRVYDFYNAPLTPTAGGFTICVTKPYVPTPANDLCTNAQVLTPASPCAGVNGTVGGALANPALDDNDDVWYSFVATSTQHHVTTTPTNGVNLTVQVYTNTCPSSSASALISNSSSNDTFVTGLTPGQTYLVRVSNFYSAAGFLSPAAGAFTICVDAPAPANNLVVSTVMNVPTGNWDNVTVTPTGVATLTGALVVNVSMVVQGTGVLVSNCQPITGAGTFALNSGAELRICDATGLFATGNNGPIRVTGTRTFSTDGLYTYNGTVPQSSGPGLPAQVRELTLSNTNGLVLNNTGVDVTRVLRLTSGNLTTSALPVRLLSSINGTALVDNAGGTVSGTVQVQRYVATTLNGGLGYRHLSAPVASPPVSQLTSSGSPVVVNPAFNAASALVRPTITPYPTVFFYNEPSVPAGGNTVTDFNQGYLSPAALSTPMNPLQGFTAQVGGGQTVTLSGALNNGPLSVSGLTYSSAGTQAGWQMLGNPYPSPLDWSTLTAGSLATNNLQNMGAAVYVYQSSGQYAGTYRSYVSGVGNPLVASSQAFFVRTAGVGQTGTFRLSNANRVTTWSATNSTLYRTTTDLRPQVRLTLDAAGQPSDETTVYFQAGATAATDQLLDAYKLRNPGATASLFSLAGADELSINGLPVLGTQPLVVPLGLRVPQAGAYTLNAGTLQNFGTVGVYLRDALTGTLVDLRQQPGYAFQVAAGALTSTTRFTLEFRPTNPTATHAGLDASLVSLYPNPAQREFTLLLPALPATTSVVARLVNALGQTVLTQTLPLTSTGATTRFDVRGLATGVYSLQLSAGGAEAPLTKRLVIE